jgi:hypothetical protein
MDMPTASNIDTDIQIVMRPVMGMVINIAMSIGIVMAMEIALASTMAMPL